MAHDITNKQCSHIMILLAFFRYNCLYPLLGTYNIITYLVFRLYSENPMNYNFWKFDNVEIVIVFEFYAISAA